MAIAKQNSPGQVNEYSLSAPGVTDWIPLKLNYNPWECSFEVSGDSAAIAGTMDASMEFVISRDPDAEPPECINSHVEFTNVTDCANGKLEYPASHVRLNVATLSAGIAKLKILQPGAQG